MEYGQVPVHGANLRYAASQMNAQGVPFQVAGQQGGVYIILVPMPYMPMVQQAPWAYQQPGRMETWAHGLARLPWIRLALIAAVLVAGAYVFQGAGLMLGLGGLAMNPQYQELMEESKQAAEAEAEGGNAIEQLLDAMNGMRADIDTQIETRTTEAKQEIGEAVTSMVIGVVALPLTAIAVLGAGWIAFRMYRRGK